MANAPCARLTKFIRPRVTERPQASTNSSMPYATPSNKMVSMAPPVSSIAPRRVGKGGRDRNARARGPSRRAHAGGDARAAWARRSRRRAINRDRGRLCPPYGAPSLSLLRGCLDRVLDVLEGRELDVVQLPVLLLDLADVHVLDD